MKKLCQKLKSDSCILERNVCHYIKELNSWVCHFIFLFIIYSIYSNNWITWYDWDQAPISRSLTLWVSIISREISKEKNKFWWIFNTYYWRTSANVCFWLLPCNHSNHLKRFLFIIFFFFEIELLYFNLHLVFL